MNASIYDIAERAHVSPSTVSRALQDHPRIGAKTKQRILAIAKELNYIPSTVARSLTANRTWTIGIVLPSVSDPFMGKVIEGVEQVAIEAGYTVFLSTSQNDRQREVAALHTLQQRRIDGVVVMSSHLFDRYSPYVSQIKLPVVLINEQDPGEHVHSVAVMDDQGARAAVGHLLALGHRRIAYLGIADRTKSNRYRMAGYQEALREAGIAPDETLVLVGEPNVADVQLGEASLSALLATGATAAFCYNDMTALGLIAACYQRRITVPYDLSVVGFDDIDLAPYAIPPLTTIRQPRFELGRKAMQMLLGLLDGQEQENIVVPDELIVRGTTAPPRRMRISERE